MFQSLKSRINNYLKDRSEIIYVYPAAACILVFFVTIISSSVYITKKNIYAICVASKPAENDYLQQYVLGSIVVGYIFLGIYANILIEFVPKLKGLLTSFTLLTVWTIGSFIWNIIGATLVNKSHCTSTSYYGIAILNLVVFFVSVGGLFFYAIYVFIKRSQGASKVQDAGATKDVGATKDIGAAKVSQAPQAPIVTPKQV